MNRPTLALRVSQHLALTPQLQQSIRLLQLSTLELAQEVEQMLADNPFLEPAEDDSGGPEITINSIADPPRLEPGNEQNDSYQAESEGAQPPESAESAQTAELADAPEQLDWAHDEPGAETGEAASDWGADFPGRSGNNDSEADPLEWACSHTSLAEHLAEQVAGLRLSPEDAAALTLLIGSLNDDGYLEDSLDNLADAVLGTDDDPQERETLLHHLQVALGLLHSLEPAGVGARNLAECLTLQLQALAQASTADTASLQRLRLAHIICHQPLEWLARRDVRRLAQACSASEDATRAAIAVIARLEPHPGRRFTDVQAYAMVPDVIVRRSGSTTPPHFDVQLNPAVMPRLRVHDAYAGALRGQRSQGHAQLQQHLQEARWFIKNVQQRFDTILRVAQAIVQRQKSFFIHGELAMRPLVLRDIAEELGVHESTISRVTTAKYMATPQGTYELKYFFGSGLGTETGGNASSTAVRALIRQFVAAENPTRPLSDSAIAELLKEQGIECARRTVAKYREALKIPTTQLRKTL